MHPIRNRDEVGSTPTSGSTYIHSDYGRVPMAITKTGIWLDKLTGEIVHTEPERGRLLVPVGDEVPDHVQVMLDSGSGSTTDPAKPTPRRKKK